jgi:hypothetical protein
MDDMSASISALLPEPFVVQPFDGVVERPRLVAAGRGVQRVKDGLGPVSAQGDRVGERERFRWPRGEPGLRLCRLRDWLLLGATHSKDERLKAQNPGAAMNPLIPMVVEQTVHGERAFERSWSARSAPRLISQFA